MKMPRAERLLNEEEKLLQKVASEKNQTKLVSFFPKKPDDVPADLSAGNAGNTALPSKDSTTEEEESEKPDCPNEWVSEEMHFAGKDRELSFSKGRPFQASWFSKNAWLTYSRGSMQHFARFVHISKNKKVHLLFTKSAQLALATGRKQLRDFKSMRIHNALPNHE